MSEDKSPIWKPNKRLLVNNPTKVTLKRGVPVAQGSGKFGNWFMWVLDVENQTVEEGKNETLKEIPNYSGEVLVFANDRLNKQFQLACVETGDDTDVLLTKVSKKMNIKGEERTIYFVKVTDLNGEEVD